MPSSEIFISTSCTPSQKLNSSLLIDDIDSKSTSHHAPTPSSVPQEVYSSPSTAFSGKLFLPPPSPALLDALVGLFKECNVNSLREGSSTSGSSGLGSGSRSEERRVGTAGRSR